MQDNVPFYCRTVILNAALWAFSDEDYEELEPRCWQLSGSSLNLISTVGYTAQGGIDLTARITAGFDLI